MVPASERRRAEARAEGFVPSSPVVVFAGALAGGGLALAFAGRGTLHKLMELARTAWSGGVEPSALAGSLAGTIARLALPVMVLALAFGWAAGLAHTRGLFTLGAFRRRGPEDDAPRPLVGWALALGLFLLAGVSLYAALRGLGRSGSAVDAARVTASVLDSFFVRALLLVSGAALADYGWRRARWERALAMTPGDVERERREEEGDPRLRAERRRRHRESPPPPKT